MLFALFLAEVGSPGFEVLVHLFAAIRQHRREHGPVQAALVIGRRTPMLDAELRRARLVQLRYSTVNDLEMQEHLGNVVSLFGLPRATALAAEGAANDGGGMQGGMHAPDEGTAG